MPLLRSLLWPVPVSVALAGCTPPGTPPQGNAGPAFSLPMALQPAPGFELDAATGLPSRVLHVSSGIVLRLIPAGEFEMGEPGGQGPEKRHRRVIRSPFYLGECEVTVGEFARFVSATGYATDAERGVPEEPDKAVGAFAQTPMFHRREWHAGASWRSPFPLIAKHVLHEDHPVSQVSWNDAMAFCAHFGLSLPSEAQWEYACRAGPANGGLRLGNTADASTAELFTAVEGHAPGRDGYPTHAPARSLPPNSLGLYEMAGNVEEWTAGPFGVAEPLDGQDESVPPQSAAGEPVKVLRGASWISTGPAHCTARFGMRPFSRRDFIGFRVCAAPVGAVGAPSAPPAVPATPSRSGRRESDNAPGEPRGAVCP